jgi:nitroreductase
MAVTVDDAHHDGIVRCQNSPDMNDGIELLRSLRSVRRFTAEPIPADLLDDVLHVARWTGSAKNVQPWRLVVVQDRDRLRQLSECGDFAQHLAGAKLAIVLVMNDRRNAFDAGRLAQNIMLAAWAHGLGSCIGSIWPDHEARAKQLLGVPEERWVGIAISIGYPADENARWLSRSRSVAGVPIGRLELGDLVSWEKLGQASSLSS